MDGVSAVRLIMNYFKFCDVMCTVTMTSQELDK